MAKDDDSAYSEARIKGRLVENGVKIIGKESANELSNKGYGTTEDDEFILTFYEAMYLSNIEILEVEDDQGKKVDIEKILHLYEDEDDEAWTKYLTYNDLRSRGYVVRGGFGWKIDFRVYERGKYPDKTAKYLILSMQEGNPIPVEDLTWVLDQCQSLKKDLILAVMNRRGEVVYYQVSEMILKNKGGL
ncbi:MAG: tRNA-intron lyase [Thermoproteota archaeon]